MTARAAVMLDRPVGLFSEKERERLADELSSVAADIKKGATGPFNRQWIVDVPIDGLAVAACGVPVNACVHVLGHGGPGEPYGSS